MRTTLLLALALAVALNPGLTSAASPKSLAWDRDLGRVIELLKEGQYEKAERKVERLNGELVAHFGPGKRAEEILGLVQLYRAVAAEGVGDHERALWHWDTALALYPAIVGSDLSGLGPAGEALEGRLPAETCPLPPSDQEGDAPAPTDAAFEVEPPRPLHKPQPDYPRGAINFDVQGQLRVQTIIDTEGRLSTPRVIEPLPAPSLTLAALEAMREWRFEPARIEGRPVCVWYVLTVNYRVER